MKFLKLSFLLFFAGMINCSAQIARSVDFHNRYKLSKVVIMGRHHVRSAALTKGERRITPHEWHQWTVDDGNLSERGMLLEQLMGVYFRHWATNEQLLDFNSSISADSVFIYANSMSRTVETASNFAIGFFPSAQIEVNYNKEVDFGSMDPVFFDKDFKISDVFKAKVNAEVEYGCGEGGFAGAIQDLERDAQVLADVLDISSAPSCLNGDTCGFHFDNAKVYLHLNWMPRITGRRQYYSAILRHARERRQHFRPCHHR